MDEDEAFAAVCAEGAERTGVQIKDGVGQAARRLRRPTMAHAGDADSQL